MEEQITNLAVGKGVKTDEITEDILLEKQPTHRFVKTSEVAAVVVSLCSPRLQNLLQGPCSQLMVAGRLSSLKLKAQVELIVNIG